MPSISSERVSWNRRASVASLAAYESAPTRVAWKRPEPATTKLPERTSSPTLLLIGSLSPVSSDSSISSPSAIAHDAVARDLVAGAQLEQVVEHDRLDRDLRPVAVAHHPGRRRVQHRELVEGALGPHLLEDADAGVGDQHDRERGVLDRTDHQDHDEQRAEDGVEPGEHVGADDLAERAAGALAGVVGLPARRRAPAPRPRSGRVACRGSRSRVDGRRASGSRYESTRTRAISPVASSSSTR